MASYNFATESQREHHEKTPLMISSASVQDAPHLWKRRRKLFLLLTEPESSFWATIVFVVLIASITLSNVIMVIQTMESWQFTPTDCRTCGGDITYLFEDDDQIHIVDGPCTCPPTPLPITESLLRCLMYLFTVEWTLRAICFTADPAKATSDVRQFYDYLTSAPMMLDFLAIFPYYLAFVDIHALVSLRLLRLFRIFSLVRLGQYNSMMMTLTNVLTKSIQYLKLLILILTFGGALFGSIVYWMERGTWKYYEPSNSYQFVRLRVDGVTEEISPFRSIPTALWWFIVTATTVGYGDCYPTSTAGQLCAAAAMLVGILVIAFPVSIFSELWSEEVKLNNELQKDESASTPAKTIRTSSSDGTVVMDKEDLKSIAECIRAIRENENHLQSILSKYNLESVLKEMP